MIIGFFINILSSILAFFINLLPILNIPAEWTTAITLIWGYINAMSFLLPITTLLTILGIVLTIEVVIFVWHFGLKIYHMLRG